MQGVGVGPCPYCGAIAPPCYYILAGSAPAQTANTTYVDHFEQDHIIQSASRPTVAVVHHPLDNHMLLVTSREVNWYYGRYHWH